MRQATCSDARSSLDIGAPKGLRRKETPMFRSTKSAGLFGLAAAVLTLSAWSTPASAASPVGPKQVFIGLVNGKFANAQIQVGCFGPVGPGQSGHVLPGQTVEVLPAPSAASTAGYTGTKAKRIELAIVLPVASGGGPSSTTAVILSEYGKPVAIPTELVVPCGGSAVAVFIPKPTSKSARPASVGVSFVSPGVSPQAAASPRIVARPANVMVNQDVALLGTGFAPETTLKVIECSLKVWAIGEKPCLSDNAVTVHTSMHGSFRATMKAQICPAITPPHRTERTCYIGVPQPSGVDTIRLEGAARIVVSWP